jgi:hypothetical protein
VLLLLLVVGEHGAHHRSSGFLLFAASAGTRSRAAAVRFVLPQATAIFTDELPSDLKPLKLKTEPPLSDYLLAAATVALHQISRRGDALASRCALPLKQC